MEGNLSKLAIGGAATAATASVGAPVYYLVNQQQEQMDDSKKPKPIRISPYRQNIDENERILKINSLSAGDVTGDGGLTSVKNFLERHPGCEVLVKKNGEIKPFYK